VRTIAVFTATRAEYGLLRPLLQQLRVCPQCRLKIIVSGTHLSPEHGYTLREIQEDGFSADALIPLDLSCDTAPHLCGELGNLVRETGAALQSLHADMLVLLGDRYECLGAALAAAMLRVPIAHIHGGEITEGAMDDSFRHAISKLAHLHFASCEPYRQRIIQMGEQPDKVWNVGSLGVENVRSLALLDAAATRGILGVPEGGPYILCTFHPVTLEPGQELAQVSALCRALDSCTQYQVIFTGVNADPGSGVLSRALHQYAAAQPERVRVFQSLGVLRYLSAAKHAACVVGNSSSGILEVPSLGVPVVNIGNRQKGRIASCAVLHCSPEEKDIAAAVREALTPERRRVAGTTCNPYDKAGTSARIAEILQAASLEDILAKKFYDLRCADGLETSSSLR